MLILVQKTIFYLRTTVKITILLCGVLFATPAIAQSRLITGKVTDSHTGEPVPYVTVSVQLLNGTRKGTATDFDGLYHLSIPQKIAIDTLYCSYLGYKKANKKLMPTATEVNFQLVSNSKILGTVNITPKGYINPALAIMAAMVKHKPDNDLQKLKSYQYESYNRIEFAITNLSDKMKQRKIFKQILPIMDSLKKTAGEDGTPLLPIFMSETLSNYYHQTDPSDKKEEVMRTRSTGVGIEDETLISQLVGTTFLQYNFYSNYLKLAGKEFISPLSDSWRVFYNYELIDEHDKINGKEYYKLEFKPRRAHDLSFEGVMWLTKDSYALYQIDATVSEDANLNFINKVRIQQEMVQPDSTTAWIPGRTRIVVNISPFTKNSSGFIGKFYLSNNKFAVNKTYPDGFFKESLVLAKDVNKKDDGYWLKNRHDSLTVADKREYQIIDTVKNLPLVKTYASIAGTLITGYYKAGPISFGPYPYTYSHNDLEGSVVRLGGITNNRFSDKWILGGYIAYAFSEVTLKYNATIEYIFSRKPWVEGGVSYLHDLGQTGYQYESFAINGNNVFNATILNGQITIRGPFFQNVIKGYMQTDLLPDLRAKITLSHSTFDPLFNFTYHDPDDLIVYTDYQTAEIGAELLWRPGTRLLQSSKTNRRVTVGSGTDNPAITFRYVRGIKGLQSDFNYDKFFINIQQKPHIGIFGKGDYSLTLGYIPGNVPYPLVENHRYSFNTMRYLEFASDKYVSLAYTQHMEGLITNSIPLLKALNIRTLLVADILDGTLSTTNNEAFKRGRTIVNKSLNGVPYVEAGYGFENIFKIMRVDFLYRLTHLDNINSLGVKPSTFATRVTLQFKL
jgi:hypothetical protein